MGLCFIPDVGDVNFVRWNPESQLKNTKIVCNNSWIGIEGLPLNMWNKHVFKVIGRWCGGLLDIARCTLDLTCLTHAEIKLKGREGGLIQEKMEIFCWGKRVQIKFFHLTNSNSGFHRDRHMLGSLTKVEDEDDVVIRTDNFDLTEEDDGYLLSAKSNNWRKERAVGMMDEGTKINSNLEDFGRSGILQKVDRVDPVPPHFMGSRKKGLSENPAWVLTSALVQVKNQFELLADEVTCCNSSLNPMMQMGSGQAQDREIYRSSSLVGQVSGHKTVFFFLRILFSQVLMGHVPRAQARPMTEGKIDPRW